MLPLLVPLQRLPHIKGILAAALLLGPPLQIITVVPDHAPVDAVAHLAIHVDGGAVALAHVEIDEPGRGGVARLLERPRQQLGVPVPPVRGRDGQDRDVSVPRQGGGRGRRDVVCGRGLEFAHY